MSSPRSSHFQTPSSLPTCVSLVARFAWRSASSWRRVVSCAVVAVCAACGPNPPAASPEGGPTDREQLAPLERAQAVVAGVVAEPLITAREAVQVVIPPTPPVIPPRPLVDPRAVDLIVHYEVTSAAFYRSRLQGVIWPGGASGATWGIGYDGGHQTRAVIAQDWGRHEQLERLLTTAGITGQRARELVRGLTDVLTAYAYAYEVFELASLPVYHGRARRAFGPEAFDRLPPLAAGALVSLVYNRGAGMAGDSRREMRVIRDECIPSSDIDCIAREIRAMCRLWRGTVNEAGLCRRRDAEAALVLEGA